MEQQGTPITLADLKTGDLVSIVLLTDRSGITDIFKLQLLTEGK